MHSKKKTQKQNVRKLKMFLKINQIFFNTVEMCY